MESFTEAWSFICEYCKKHITEVAYTTWISRIEPVSLDFAKGIALLKAPNEFHRQTLNRCYMDLLNDAVAEIFGPGIQVQICVPEDVPSAEKEEEEDASSQNDDYEFTFDTFIVGPSNKFAHAASMAVATKPATLYNPLFIYGNSGLGKTHLLNAIGNYVSEHAPDKKVYYTTSEDFVNAVVNSIKNGQIQEFKEEMNDLDVLLVDDIQFLAGKEKSHETFFYIFNELVNNKKQICLTSDRHPTEIKGLEERLISRFSSGLSVGVDSPEFETSVAILKVKLEKQSVDPSIIDDDVLAYIASNFSQDVRKLEGALNRLLFYSINFSNSTRIDFKTAVSAFRGQAQTIDKNDLTASKIIRCVADYYGLTKLQLVSKTRTKNIATARHMAMYLCRKHLDMPYVKIGDEFGKRDHSTVMSACEKVEKGLKNDETYRQAVGELEKLMQVK